jgi:AraC-like DNA-binding protein
MSPIFPTIPPLDPQRFAPRAHWPVRAKLRPLRASSRVEPHRHGWAQMSFSLTGVSRILTSQMTCIVPPTRAVWIPPQVEHAVAVLRDADMLTLYLHHPPDAAPHWQRCRVVEVSPLLAELIGDELLRARSLPLGIALPQDKRLRTLCEALIEEPTRHARLADWAAGSGASARTVARLFRDELGTSFQQWRQQVLLARALVLATEGRPMGVIAAELGYASPSAFSAMVTRTVGMAPGRFFAPGGAIAEAALSAAASPLR